MGCAIIPILVAPLLVILSLSTAFAAKCTYPQQFWSNELQSCQDCTRCQGLHVTIRPCGVDRDTTCGPLSSLGLKHPGMPPDPPETQRNNYSEPPTYNTSSLKDQDPFSSVEILVLDWQIAALVAGVVGLCLVFCLVGVLVAQQVARHCCGRRASIRGQWEKILVGGADSHQQLYMDSLLDRKQDDDPRYH